MLAVPEDISQGWTPRSYVKEFLRSFRRSWSLLGGLLGLFLGIAGVIAGYVSGTSIALFLLSLSFLILLWNSYVAARSLTLRVARLSSEEAHPEVVKQELASLKQEVQDLHSKLHHAEIFEELIKSRSRVRAIRKRRVVQIGEKGEEDIIITEFDLVALDKPVRTFLCMFSTDRKDYDFNKDRHWKIDGGKVVGFNRYDIGRKLSRYIIENQLDKPVFPNKPTKITVTHRATVVAPEEDWAGIAIIEQTEEAILEIWFPRGWQPLPESIFTYIMHDSEEIPVEDLPQLRQDLGNMQWVIVWRILEPDRFVSHCVRWKAKRKPDDSRQHTSLHELEPRRPAEHSPDARETEEIAD